ncbi:MAG: hypothetical protein KGZ37_07915 [Nitrosarchaeum sp.]|nr:hypothetical protein [Nitrosarchaeum sp.]
MTFLGIFNQKTEFSSIHVIISLSILAVIGMTIRLFYFQYEIPLTFDALLYFWYANDLSISHKFPEIVATNNGWPIFLSLFFSIYDSNNFLDYMNMQRIIAMSLSVITIIPIYLICKKFAAEKFALVGGAIFILEPRIIQNSIFGITEPLYLLLFSISLVLFLSSNKKMIYISSAIIGICSIVRAEGLLIFLVFSIVYFIKFRKEGKRIIPKYVLCITIIILIILPMMIIRTETIGADGLITRYLNSIEQFTTNYNEENHIIYDKSQSLIKGFETLIKFLGWSSIPIFIIFVPIGIFSLLKTRKIENILISTSFVIMIIPALYAYSVPALDVRYLFILYPLFGVCSVLSLEYIYNKFKIKNDLFLIITVIGIIILSISFLEFKMVDVEHNIEAFELAEHVANIVGNGTIFHYGQEEGFLEVVGFSKLNSFPILNEEYDRKAPEVIRITGLDFQNLQEYIEFGRERGLTHLVLDGKLEPEPVMDAFYNIEKYPYLIKKFDSKEFDYSYHLQIYQIDYEKFDEIKNKSN